MLSRIAKGIVSELGYLIVKGGTTSQTVLQEGFAIDLLHLEGQLLPGLSLVRALDRNELEGLPIVTFPGNLGDSSTLLNSWKIMESC